MSIVSSSQGVTKTSLNMTFVVGALVILIIARVVKWHFEFELGFTTVPLNLLLLGSIIGFTIPWLIVAGAGNVLISLSGRNPGWPRHLEFYLWASLWLVVYHMIVLWVRTVTELQVPVWIGWILQLGVYTGVAYTNINLRRKLL